MLTNSDDNLFNKIINNPNHTIYQLLPPQSITYRKLAHTNWSPVDVWNLWIVGEKRWKFQPFYKYTVILVYISTAFAFTTFSWSAWRRWCTDAWRYSVGAVTIIGFRLSSNVCLALFMPQLQLADHITQQNHCTVSTNQRSLAPMFSTLQLTTDVICLSEWVTDWKCLNSWCTSLHTQLT